MAGYSTKTLVEKLGIKENFKVYLDNPPSGYDQTLGQLPPHVTIYRTPAEKLDFIHIFVTDQRQLEERFPKLRQHLVSNGTLWVSWPKHSSRIQTNLNENIIREIGLRKGMVDVKVCAVDEKWSGLKFVYRLKDRT